VRLYYYVDPEGNFGDDLNPWLWSRLYPEILSGKEDELFLGIGTLLNHRLPKGVPKHVFGSGYGYGAPPDVSDGFVFHAVRGVETARALGLESTLAITDPAVLIRVIDTDHLRGTGLGYGFIPHAASNQYFDWSLVCEELQLLYIDARSDVDSVIRQILSCDVVLCEAMHGAIVADALRVPWIPVVCYDYISEFKWRDWMSSIEMEYRPHRVTSLFDVERNWSLRRRARTWVKRRVYNSGLMVGRGWRLPPSRTGLVEYRNAVHDLKLASASRPCLSQESLIASLTDRYVNLLGRFKQEQMRICI
jgi:succinoglycan biosynthesis protein ExoV